MADFLPALRGNLLSSKRPLGMPDIDTGGLGKMLRQIGPLASSLEDDELRRKKELMSFEQSLRSQPQQRSMLPNRPVVQGPARVNYAPPTSMQRQLANRDEEERQNKFRLAMADAERGGKLEEIMTAGNLRNEGDMAQLMQEINARKEIGTAERGSREKIAETEMRGRTGESALDRATRISEGAANRASAEKIAQLPARASQTPISPSQQGNAFTNKIQQLAIDNPTAAAMLVQDPNTKQYTFKPGSTPEQQAWIRKYLGQGNKAPTRTTKGNPQKAK